MIQVMTAHAVAGAPTCGAARPCTRQCADRRAAARATAAAVEALTGATPVRLTLLHRAGEPARIDRGPKAAISVSHVNGRAVAAAAPSGRLVGVDLERAGSVADSELRLFATPAERAAGIDATTLWVLKEAAWKGLRCGRDTPFHQLSLRFDAAGALRGVTLHGVHRSAQARVWAPWRGWVAAMVEVDGADEARGSAS